MSKTIKFEMDKNQLKIGIYEFKVYDSCGYSGGETTIFLYKGYVYLYNDECESYKYNKPFDQCTNKELEKFVNSTIDSEGDFAWDGFTTKEEWNKDFEKGEHWDNFDDMIEDLADNSYEDFEPFTKKTRTKWKTFLVRDNCNYNTIYFIIKLENQKYWDEAKEYLCKVRDSNKNNCMADSEIMEEYWNNNNIKYQMLDLPEENLYL